MREHLLWHDPPSYFDHDAGFIGFNFDLPAEVVSGSTPLTWVIDDINNTLGHFQAVNLQLGQLRSAFGFAQVLGRAVAIPELTCGMDRFWAPHEGELRGLLQN